MERQIRRYEDTLSCIGTGVLILSIWSILRTIVQIILQDQETGAELAALLPDADVSSLKTAMYIFIIVMMLIDFFFCLYVGMSARAEARGKKKTILYLIFSAIMIFIHAVSIYYLFAMPGLEGGILGTIVSAIIEATTIVIQIELIYASIRLRKLRKEALK